MTTDPLKGHSYTIYRKKIHHPTKQLQTKNTLQKYIKTDPSPEL